MQTFHAVKDLGTQRVNVDSSVPCHEAVTVADHQWHAEGYTSRSVLLFSEPHNVSLDRIADPRKRKSD
jgi:hypothetical protein